MANAVAPTRVLQRTSASWSTATSRALPSFDCLAGDVLLVQGHTEDTGTTTLTPAPPTGGTFTWTTPAGFPTTTASSTKEYAWYATSASDQTGVILTSSVSVSGAHGGLYMELWRGSNGIGTILTPTHVTISGGPQSSFTTSDTHSAVSFHYGDWAAVNGARTYLTGAGTPTEGFYDFVLNKSTVLFAYHPDIAAAGANTIGVSAPATNNWWFTAFEVLGSAGVAAPILNNRGTEVWPNAASAPGSPTAGMVYYDTTDSRFRVYDGSSWS